MIGNNFTASNIQNANAYSVYNGSEESQSSQIKLSQLPNKRFGQLEEQSPLVAYTTTMDSRRADV